MSCFISSQFLLRAYTSVSYWVAERFIRHIVGCCLLLFVSLINFSPCQKANCVSFVSGDVVGEFDIHDHFTSNVTYLSWIRI